MQDLATSKPYTAVVMAGQRASGDPLATSCGVSHKCLIEISGRAMLEHVLRGLEASDSVARIVLCVDDGFAEPTWLAPYRQRGLERIRAAHSPAASAALVCRELQAFPLLITTADHPLLDARMVDYFCHNIAADCDVTVGLAQSHLVLASYPNATRTFLRFTEGPFCGCNLFAFNRANAASLAAYWQGLERERKRPWRLVKALGAATLWRYMRGSLSLDRALERLSTQLSVSAGYVEMPFAEAAIDVDKASDRDLVEQIMHARSTSD